MNDHIERLARRIYDEVGVQPRNELRAVLWDIDADAWERGVMFKGGPGTIMEPRPENPYRKGLSKRSHYAEAERLLEEAYHALENGQRAIDYAYLVEAQVQALLAVADALRPNEKADNA